jgi:hypothetical protein
MGTVCIMFSDVVMLLCKQKDLETGCDYPVIRETLEICSTPWREPRSLSTVDGHALRMCARCLSYLASRSRCTLSVFACSHAFFCLALNNSLHLRRRFSIALEPSFCFEMPFCHISVQRSQMVLAKPINKSEIATRYSGWALRGGRGAVFTACTGVGNTYSPREENCPESCRRGGWGSLRRSSPG